MEKSRKGAPALMELGGELTIAQAETRRKALSEALGGGAGVVLRFQEVRDADLSFVQLLCSAHRSFFAAGQTLTIEGAVPAPVLKILQEAKITACSCGTAVKDCLWKQEGV